MTKSAAATELGRKGGQARARNLTKEQRIEGARIAGKASAAKRKQQKQTTEEIQNTNDNRTENN